MEANRSMRARCNFHKPELLEEQTSPLVVMWLL